MLVLESCLSLFLLLIKGRELRFPDPSEVEGEGSSDSAGAGIASVSVYNVSFLGQVQNWSPGIYNVSWSGISSNP